VGLEGLSLPVDCGLVDVEGSEGWVAAMKYVLWLVLALPGLWQIWKMSQLETITFQGLDPIFGDSGMYAGWLIVLTLCITPLNRLFRGNPVARWLMRERRYFGVACFGYSALHTYQFLAAGGYVDLRGQLLYIPFLTGWIALAILFPLFLTSNDLMMRILGPAWKRLQWWAWVAGALTFAHWITMHRGSLIVTAFLSFLPLFLLMPTRFGKRKQPERN
jgi:sulfoxide reductase heme-binding subunit YedZ